MVRKTVQKSLISIQGSLFASGSFLSTNFGIIPLWLPIHKALRDSIHCYGFVLWVWDALSESSHSELTGRFPGAFSASVWADMSAEGGPFSQSLWLKSLDQVWTNSCTPSWSEWRRLSVSHKGEEAVVFHHMRIKPWVVWMKRFIVINSFIFLLNT